VRFSASDSRCFLFSIAGANIAEKQFFALVGFCVGGSAGYWNSGKAMDSVAGKLPKDEQ
jgi:hypothetical protein